MTTAPLQRASLWPHAIGALWFLAAFSVIGGWTGPGQPSAALEAAWTLATSAPYVLAWLGAALGYGWVLRLAFARAARDAVTIQVGLGVAAMLFIDHLLGVLGLMQVSGAAGAWIICAVGLAALALQVVRLAREQRRVEFPDWLIWLASPCVATLLVAACSAPGVLWASEFGGYDALSYHLQLPREWADLGRIQPLEHNIYSFLPGYVEAAYYHIAVLHGDAIYAAYSCQLLHAALTLLSAYTLTRLIGLRIHARIGLGAGVLLLGTPWIIVVGSLAYIEMAVVLMLIAAVAALCEEELSPANHGLIVGFCGAVACGAKLTAAGMVVVPLLSIVLIIHRPRTWLRVLSWMLLAGITALAPYFVRNAIFGGNPVFPFATELFGTSHWTDEQIAIWQRGHTTGLSLAQRLTQLWHQFFAYGIGPNPSGGTEPWKPQWSALPWLGMAGLVIALFLRTRRVQVSDMRPCAAGNSNEVKQSASTLGFPAALSPVCVAAIIALQLLFWLTFTHLKSRFLLPAATPLAIGVCVALGAMLPGLRRRVVSVVAMALLLLWSLQPAVLFYTEAEGQPAIGVGAIGVMTGDALSQADRETLGRTTFSAVAMNYLFPPTSKILGIGFATPFYVRRPMTYNTTWDRGVLSQAMHEFPDDSAAWAHYIRQKGFTHLAVNDIMLQVWEHSGWNDPLVTLQRVHDLAQRHATLLYRYPDGTRLYQLTPTERTP